MMENLPNGVDHPTFKEMVEIMEEEFAPLLQTYLDDTPALLTQIRSATSSTPADFEALAAAAHQLKSTSGSLGFTELEGLARTLERTAQSADEAAVNPLLERAEYCFQQLTPFLQGYL